MDLKSFLKEYFGSFFLPGTKQEIRVDSLNPELCVTPLPGPFSCGLALGSYSEDTPRQKTDLGKLIYLMKYRHSVRAAERLAAFLINYLKINPFPNPPYVLITVPDSITNRPFSPVGYLADQVASHFGWIARHDILARLRLEKPQKDRDFKEKLADKRLRYFLKHPRAVKGKHILLFDDIYDTGRSLTEAAHLINEQSPASLTALTLVKLGGD